MSVFTFGTEPTRVSSPWLQPAKTPVDVTVTKLEAEPQEGAIEYKLHLLLRPRRPYRPITNGARTASGSQRPYRDESTSGLDPRDIAEPKQWHASGPGSTTLLDEKKQKPASEYYATTSESRRLRLYHLTTQLLWRLKQSMVNGPLGTTESLIPKLPADSVDLAAAVKPGTLWQGLEESRGALYEIGVSDDGTLVGLPDDEMEESLLTLRVMAASLGCVVQVTRRQCVGECEGLVGPKLKHKCATPVTYREKLYVAEAMVTPSRGGDHLRQDQVSEEGQFIDGVPNVNPFEKVICCGSCPQKGLAKGSKSSWKFLSGHSVNDIDIEGNPTQVKDVETRSTVEQLRVTLTGPTDGGKSTLLGTLSTGIFDNGSGRSRTFLLRHRHELASGITTSLSHMLIGYKNNGLDENLIYSFSDRNIDSWEASTPDTLAPKLPVLSH